MQLDGSLIVLAGNVVGSTETNAIGESILQYGRRYCCAVFITIEFHEPCTPLINFKYIFRCARCKLENVKVLNNGIDWKSGDNQYWQHNVKRLQALKVILHGNAEFEATDVVIQVNWLLHC